MNCATARRIAPLVLLVVSGLTPAAVGIDAAKSHVVATFKQMNVPVEGNFTKVAGNVQFDPAKPEQGAAQIEIDTASFDIGQDEYNSEVRKPEWFDSSKFPKATFISSSLKSLGAGRYQATGALTVKGKSQTISVILTARSEAAAMSFDGSLPVSRKFFGIGDPAWQEAVDDTVNVQFHIVQPR